MLEINISSVFIQLNTVFRQSYLFEMKAHQQLFKMTKVTNYKLCVSVHTANVNKKNSPIYRTHSF